MLDEFPNLNKTWVSLRLIDSGSTIAKSSFDPNRMCVVASDLSDGEFLFCYGRRHLASDAAENHWDHFVQWGRYLREQTIVQQ